MVLPECRREINFCDEISLLKQKLHKHAYMVIIALAAGIFGPKEMERFSKKERPSIQKLEKKAKRRYVLG
jgi:hypothetical protein